MTSLGNKISGTQSRKPRGKNAIEHAHEGIALDDEVIINFKICEMYSVNLDEARDIHINYHEDRLFVKLVDRAVKIGMTEHDLIDQLNNLSLQGCADDIGKGRLLERAAIDALYKKLCIWQTSTELKDNKQDRYMRFYG
jgi:hypothetical protein